MAIRWVLVVALAWTSAVRAQQAPVNARNEAAVQEVLAGKRSEANAAWWGFDPADSTAALQAAIDSKARTVVVPYMGAPWVVRPITLRSNQEILMQPGVVVLAKQGEFRGRGDSLFTAAGEANLVLRGYGATLRMRKTDYQNPPYDKAEWRMGIALRGCRNVRIEGLRVESTGGDGFYVDGGGGRAWSQDIVIRDCVAHDNHRQGISVISAVNLLVENCVLSATRGTAPEAGIDLEPDSAEQRLVNCVIRDCIFENNHGHQMLVYLKQLSNQSEPVSIRFENCLARMRDAEGGWAGMSVGAARDDGPKGLVEFRDCTAENTGREGAKVYDKSAESVLVRFVRCHWKDPWVAASPDYAGPRVPVYVQLRNLNVTKQFGGVELVDCSVHDRISRPALLVDDDQNGIPVRNLHGTIAVDNPARAGVKLGRAPVNTEVQVLQAGR